MLTISESNFEFKSQLMGFRTCENIGVNLTPEGYLSERVPES